MVFTVCLIIFICNRNLILYFLGLVRTLLLDYAIIPNIYNYITLIMQQLQTSV